MERPGTVDLWLYRPSLMGYNRQKIRRRDRPVTATILDEYILPALLRYRDRYHWSWNMAMRLINMYYGTDYTERQLKKLYRLHQKMG